MSNLCYIYFPIYQPPLYHFNLNEEIHSNNMKNVPVNNLLLKTYYNFIYYHKQKNMPNHGAIK